MAGTSRGPWQRPARSTRCRQAARRRAIRSAEGGASVTLRGLTWRPARRRTPVLRDLDLHVPEGQRVLVTGPSGAGKSTLLRAMAGLLLTSSAGDLSGSALVDGEPVERAAPRPALLFQDPTAGVVADTVGRDVAFGLENAAVPRAEIWPRVRAALAAACFPYPVDHPTSALSGGEAQRLALAGTLAAHGRVLLLDEPVAMLDPASADAVLSAVRRHADETGATVVVVDHRLDPWLDFAERLVVLDRDGGVLADGELGSVLSGQADALLAAGVWVPGTAAPRPLAVSADAVAPAEAAHGDVVTADAVSVLLDGGLASRRAATLALRGVDARLEAGCALAVTGPSGAGKSTLVSVLAGLRRPTSGRVTVGAALADGRGRPPYRWRSRDLARRFAWVPQLAEQGVVTTTVIDEVLASSRACGRDGSRARRRAEELLETLGLAGLEQVSPYHLSAGQQRRLMVAAALAGGPNALLIDEPTVGQDRITWAAVAGAMSCARDAGAAVGFASHDAALVSALADGSLRLDRGSVAA